MSVKIIDEEDFVCCFMFPNEDGKPTYKTEHGFSCNIADAKIFKTREEAEECAKTYRGKYESSVFGSKVTMEHTDDVIVNGVNID